MTHDEVIADVAELKSQMEIALAGVENFRRFQLTSARNDGYLKALATLWSVVFAVILAVGGYAVKESYPVIKAIIEDYYQHHPAVTERIQHERGSLEQETARDRQPEISTIPPLRGQ